MRRMSSWIEIMLLGVVLLWAGVMGAHARSAQPDAQTGTKITAEQQQQLDRLAQLDEQLQKSRSALHAAINDYGWDSEQADEAREKLVNDRAEYRKLRRSLVASGVSVPPPTGLGAGGPGRGPGPGMGRGQGRHHGCHHCGDCGNW